MYKAFQQENRCKSCTGRLKYLKKILTTHWSPRLRFVIRQKSLPSEPLACEIWTRESVPCPELTRCSNITKNIICLTSLLAALEDKKRKGETVQAALWFLQGKSEPFWTGEETPASDTLLNSRSLMAVPTIFKCYIPTWSSPSVLGTKWGTVLLPLAPSAPAGEVIKFEWRNLSFSPSIKNTKHLSQDKIFKYAATFSSPFTPVTVCAIIQRNTVLSGVFWNKLSSTLKHIASYYISPGPLMLLLSWQTQPPPKLRLSWPYTHWHRNAFKTMFHLRGAAHSHTQKIMSVI